MPWVAGAAGWIGSLFSGAAFGGGVAGAAASAAAWGVVSAGVGAAVKQNNEVKGEGNLLDLQINASAPRQLVIGKHMIGGTLVDWFVSGEDNNLLKLVVYLSEGPCGNIKRVFGGGRQVWSGTMTHGVRTPITEYEDGGNGSTLLHITYYDGREGQSAPSALVGSGWSSNNKMTGCAYVVVEARWTRGEMPSPPTLTYELEGVKLYDRRKDTTAGGSGSHRLDSVSTWEFSDNPMVVLDHYLLGRYWGDQRVMGIGLDPEQVPYDRFAAMANICDEDVTTLSGGTQKRYRANGGIWASSYYGDVIKDLCKAMAARPADFGGRIGVIGSETRSPVLTIDDGDLIEGLPEVYTPKRQWTELVGAVEGRYKDPDNLYQDVDYPRISDNDWEVEDGGEPRVETLDLNFETDIERAQRLALLYAKRERRQATLQGTYPPYAIELEQGDWFIRTGDRWGEDGKTFEVLTRVVDAASLLVTITAFEVDASDSAWSADMASPKPADAVPNSMLLGSPEVPVVTATGATVSGTNSTLPALLVSWDELTDTRIEYLVIEVYQTSDDKRVATVNVSIPDADNSTTIVGGIVEGVSYYVRARSVTGSSKSDWSDDDSATSSGDYIASSIKNQGWAATAPRDEVENAELTPLITTNSVLIAAETETRIDEDTAIVTSLNAFQAAVASPNANLVGNSNFSNGLEGWTNGTGSFFASSDGEVGTYASASGANSDFYSDEFAVNGSAEYTFAVSARGVNYSDGEMRLVWYDSSHVLISGSDILDITADSSLPPTRFSKTVTSPSNAAYAVVSISVGAMTGFFQVLKVKVEHGDVATTWTDETTVLNVIAAANSATTAIATEASSRVTADDAIIAAYEAGDTSLSSDINDVADDVSDLTTVVSSKASNTRVDTVEADAAGALSTSETTLRAEMQPVLQGFGLIKNSLFNLPASGTVVPPEWTDWQNGSGTLSEATNASGNVFSATGGAGANAGFSQLIEGLTAGDKYKFTAVVELITGTLNGAGLQIIYRNGATTLSSESFIFASEAPVGKTASNSHTGLIRYEKEVTAPATCDTIVLYVITHWSVFGDVSVANAIDWYEVDLNPITGIEASVTTVSSAVTDIEGAAAYYNVEVAASGSEPALATMQAGKDGSEIGLIAKIIRLKNIVGSTTIEIMRAVGGYAFFSNPISVDVGSKRLTVGPTPENVLWFGNDSVDPPDQTRANCNFSLGTDGEIYRNGAVLITGNTAFDFSFSDDFNGSRSGTGLVTSNTVTISLENNTGSITYIWEILTKSGAGPTPTFTNDDGASTAMTGTYTAGQGAYGLAKCTVVNGDGTVVTKAVEYTLDAVV